MFNKMITTITYVDIELASSRSRFISCRNLSSSVLVDPLWRVKHHKEFNEIQFDVQWVNETFILKFRMAYNGMQLENKNSIQPLSK